MEEGTYIRVGSTNRQASSEIIAELERQSQGISFDSEPVFRKTAGEINIASLERLFFEKTGEKLTGQVISKLDLIKQEQGKELH